ncbi:uncharacterized protein LOC128242197 [Mya arenaria]|uniref:uncharacterized protein LOC128242197 n=1 Tax=Mya arenaria TaxID=6604 RepID=UPI0022E19217|nr:uncharacterized protein LOC128242197 [Mya arenaria]XP_052815233.1 uncharacterized protein LOC128242197 [Mya arenaria]
MTELTPEHNSDLDLESADLAGEKSNNSDNMDCIVENGVKCEQDVDESVEDKLADEKRSKCDPDSEEETKCENDLKVENDSDSNEKSNMKTEKLSDSEIEKVVKRELNEAVEIRVPKLKSKKDISDYNWLQSCGMKSERSSPGRRPDTPPLQRLMRQDLPALKSNIASPSPPKRFKDSITHKEGFTSKLASVIIPSSNSTLPPKLASHPKQLLSHNIANLRTSSSKSSSLLKSSFSTSSLLSRSYPVSQPVFPNQNLQMENDQPLDLSRKTGKSSNDSKSRSSSKSLNAHESGLSSTSLQSLQQKFGGDFHLRGLRKPLNYMLYGPEIPALHQALLHSASMGLPPYPLPFSNGFPKITPEKHRHSNSTPSPSKPKHEDSYKSLKHEHRHNGKATERDNSDKDIEQDQGNEDKQGENYTNHLCTCGKWYDGLYSLSLHLQETGHLPARNKSVSLLEYPKLVRGQDMWLNQESEQTRRILRCIQCGESFKTLPLLTVHMMKTQHYTKIVSSEHARRAHKCSAYCDKDADKECVFKCKVCEDTFPDMEGLANHMILSGHHKKQARTNQPVSDMHFKKRKRYSFEEALNPFGNPSMTAMFEYKRHILGGQSSPEMPADEIDDNRISCENCGQKIEMKSFVEHVRACLGQKLKEDVARFEKEKENFRKLEKEKRMSSEHNDSSSDKESSPVKKRRMEENIETVNGESGRESIDIKEEKDDIENDNELKEADTVLENSKSLKKCSESVETNSENSDYSLEAGEITDKSKNILKEIQTLVESKGRLNEKVETEKFVDEIKTETKKLKNNATKKLDIIDPDNTKDGESGEGSALSAMESFIKKSFSSKFDYKKGNIIINPHTSADATIHPKPLNSSVVGFESADYLSRYKNFYAALNLNNGFKYESQEKEKGRVDHSNHRNGLKSSKNEKERNGKLSPKSNSDDEKEDGRNSVASAASDSSSVADRKENLENKYLNMEDNKDTKKDGKASALDNLSSFVYGQTLTSEHPLDSLQRLITKSDIPNLMGGAGGSGHFKFLPPHLQLHQANLDLTSPLNLSVKSPKAESDEDDTRSHKSRQDDADSCSDYEALNSPSNSDGDPTEYRCTACSRRFASKGSYRYHLSRCHLSSVKRYGIKEAFNMSPYVYLPLDHTAKFSKYYEMAKELANKAKQNKAK